MRDYGKVYSSIWSSPDFLGFSDDSKLLVMYLLTSTHTTMTGAFRLPDGYLCADLGWSNERVSKGLDELLAKGFCNRCGTTNWLWICKYLSWNPPENPNQWKAITKQVEQVPGQCAWKPDFMRYLAELHRESYPDKTNPFETVTPTLSKPVVVIGTVIGIGTGVGTGVEQRASAKPRASTPKAKRLTHDWQPGEDLRTWAESERPDLNLQTVIASFVDYWTAKSGKDATKRDWDATFRNWVRKEASNRNNGPTGPMSRAEAATRYKDEQFAEWERRYGPQ